LEAIYIFRKSIRIKGSYFNDNNKMVAREMALKIII